MKKYADEFREDLVEFREITNKFYQKEISVVEYKGFSGAFGSYAQRGGDLGMLRLRLTGGRVTKEQLDFIVESVDKHNIQRSHITTCQTIQLHDLTPATICTLIEDAWDHGIITRGGGGDYPRNVMMTPLTGVSKDDLMDVTPYVSAAAEYLLGFIKTVKLPRKLKVCFSSSMENITHATFRDLGFVATADGKFDVYSAGGLGSNPKMGVLVASGVDPCQTLYYIKAMVHTFTTYGNYEKRARARTRYMQDTLGSEGYVKAYQEKLSEVLASEDLTISVTVPEITKKGSEETFCDRRVIPQKQEGLYTVAYHPIGGNLTIEKYHQLRDTIKDMEDVELRLSPDEGMYIINLNAEEAKRVLSITEDGAKNLFETSVACIGNRICQVGLRDSQHLLALCVTEIRPYNFADGVLPKIHISGCPSSCGTQQIGIISFRGAVKQTPDGPKEAYALFSGGNDYRGKERFADDVGIMIIENIPKFLIDLGQTVTAANTTYEEWINDHKDDFLTIANKYL